MKLSPLAVAVLSATYVALAILANWLASTYFVTVPLTDLVAPAGVFAIGAILVIRDWLQQLTSVWWTLWLVAFAGVLSYAVGREAHWTSLQKVAAASLVAFIVSESLEALVFTPIRQRSLTAGVAVSAIIGTALDSFVFLSLAFGSLAFFWGQFVGKGEMILIGVVLTALRRVVLPAPAVARA